MTSPRVLNQQIEAQSVRAAAEEYIARQEMKSHPAVEEDGSGKFVIALSEKRGCCKSFLRQRFLLNRHCRGAKHVANLFDVDLQSMMEEVTRLKGE